ncbi:MAG TPA: DUF192 domain-containing protein [Rhizomicrobium sp.]|jgi:uncharacterized membrane protein (UPF0127 family)|nr:DUF192 domain-containing protein [Rhizomicrobium sp.]
MRLTIALVSVLLLAGTASAASNQPQLNLPVESITIDSAQGPQRFKVQLATKWSEQETGLMYRKQMPPNEGMLFDFHQPQMMSFWMKNTLIPLDILFIRADGTVSSIAAGAKPLSLKSIKSTEPVQAVLEINGGRAAALQIREGARVHSAIFKGR